MLIGNGESSSIIRSGIESIWLGSISISGVSADTASRYYGTYHMIEGTESLGMEIESLVVRQAWLLHLLVLEYSKTCRMVLLFDIRIRYTVCVMQLQ